MNKFYRHVNSLKQRHNNPAIVISKVAPKLEGPTIESATQEIRDSQLVSTTSRVSQPPEQSKSLGYDVWLEFQDLLRDTLLFKASVGEIDA